MSLFKMYRIKPHRAILMPALLGLALMLGLTANSEVSAQLTLERLDSSNRADNENQTRRDPINII
ncbi:MAG: hypothetical protein GTO60_02360, partial [Gammaproteobacteria bacterium]|nr:hypothetical protein [Gammaproteobacteria bacterium]NIO61372.1 hypothetical protein [Gammaproteobacteria bacterium]